MTRNQCNLYINNISDRTNEDRVISYFSQYGTIESYTFFEKTSQRNTAAAIITYGLSVDIDQIIHLNQRMKFDGRSLFLRRTLPITRPPFERFMSSNDLLISLDCPCDEQFNQMNIRKYFNKYGSIVSCRIVTPYRAYLIDFVETNSVDRAILDEPHFYNEKELRLRKYISPNQIGLFRSKRILFDQENQRNQFSVSEKIRRFKHIIEALEFGQKIQLKLIKYSYEEKKIKFNKGQNEMMMKLTMQLGKTSEDMNANIKHMKEKNNCLKLLTEQNQRIRKYVIDLYEKKVDNEQRRMNELREAIDLLSIV